MISSVHVQRAVTAYSHHIEQDRSKHVHSVDCEWFAQTLCMAESSALGRGQDQCAVVKGKGLSFIIVVDDLRSPTEAARLRWFLLVVTVVQSPRPHLDLTQLTW